MNASARWQEITAENLAASQVPGFKRQQISFEPVMAGAMPVPSTGVSNYVMPSSRVSTDFSPGGLRSTQVDTDVGIDGDGFFAVQLPSGEVGYTRDGEFHRSTSGQLLTKEGFAVLGDSGPVQLDPNNPKLFISPSGDISQGGEPKGKLRIMKFDDPSRLTPSGAGLFVASDPKIKSADVTTPSLRQGFLELSNTNSVGEMAHMIESLRMFEANQRIIQSQDERMGKAISELTAGS